jgi:sugar-specific transcriptional regulator TrmB
MVSPSDEGEGKVFTTVEVQELLDKQHDELNERFALLEAKLSIMDEKNAHPEVEMLTPEGSRTRRRLRWKLLLSLMDLLLMLCHMSIPSNACLRPI